MTSNTFPQSITIIAALTRDRAIGRDGNLLYRFPEDLRRFKALTMGHPVIMGRKTFESMPRALPGRRNIVVTRNPEYAPAGAEAAPSLEKALCMAGPQAQPFVIGGGDIYCQAMRLATRLELTLIEADGPRDADTFFPKIDPDKWQMINRSPLCKDEKTGLKFVFATYSRKIANFAPDKKPTL